jgi:hypothetical protein
MCPYSDGYEAGCKQAFPHLTTEQVASQQVTIDAPLTVHPKTLKVASWSQKYSRSTASAS